MNAGSPIDQRMRDEITWLGKLCERALEVSAHEHQRARPGRAHRHLQLASVYSEQAFDLALLLPQRVRA